MILTLLVVTYLTEGQVLRLINDVEIVPTQAGTIDARRSEVASYAGSPDPVLRSASVWHDELSDSFRLEAKKACLAASILSSSKTIGLTDKVEDATYFDVGEASLAPAPSRHLDQVAGLFGSSIDQVIFDGSKRLHHSPAQATIIVIRQLRFISLHQRSRVQSRLMPSGW